MSNISLILLAAGESSRFNMQVKKQWLRINSTPLWLFVKKSFEKYGFGKIIIVSNLKEIKYMSNFDNSCFVVGGDSRQESLKNALKEVESEYVLVSDIARAIIPESMILNIIENKNQADSIVPYLKAVDTVVYENETINRDRVKLIQTPQLSKTKILKEALRGEEIYTDDSSAIKANGGSCFYVEGDKRAKKITYFDDLRELNLQKPSNDFFIGHGFDVHPLIEGEGVVLGGVKIKAPYKFKAHSDGDVLIHSLIDSLLGAIGYSDIGELFPDSDDSYNGIDSTLLLKEVVSFVKRVGFEIINCDITIIAQTPKISPYKELIKESLANLLKVDKFRVNIKATTTEKLGFIGRKEAVAVEAVANLKFFRWDEK